MSEHHRNQTLGHARADLTQLPTYIDELQHHLEHGSTSNGSSGGKITGSPALTPLETHALLDPGRKPGWDGEDPRHHKLGNRYGAVATLEAWVRVIWEETDLIDLTETATVRSETAILIEYWGHICDQPWAERCANDITHLANRCRATLGIRPEYKPSCRYCHNEVIPVEHGGTVTTWDACAYGYCTGCNATFPPGPALTALARTQPAEPLTRIADRIGIPLRTLQRWAKAGAIRPAPNRHGKRSGNQYELAEVRKAATHLRRTVDA